MRTQNLLTLVGAWQVDPGQVSSVVEDSGGVCVCGGGILAYTVVCLGQTNCVTC